MSRRKKFLVADLLCGAGGSSTGCQRALADLGLEMELVCVNHWGVAIETHKLNHPEARHYCQDIASVRPHQVVPEGYLDLLMASPSCTHHSVARGGKPTSDQQRSDPWHVITWLTELDVERIIIENVWEFTGWGPVDPKTQRPIKERKGEYFRQWIATLEGLGYVVEWRKLNAADFGDATTRQRFVLMGRKQRPGRKAVAIGWPMPTHRKREGGKLELFPGMKPWRPAREIIDWSLKGKSIFERKKPLAPKTLARIHAGAVKFGWPEPFLDALRNHMAAQGVDGPLPTIAASGLHIGVATPMQVVMPAAEPFILSRQSEGAPRSTDAPMPTNTTVHSPVLVTAYYGANTGCTSGDEPLPTITTKDRFGVVVPLTHAGGHDRVIDIEQPTSMIAATGHVNLVEGVVDGERRYDILFRMLEPHELAAAMGFTDEDFAYEFAGTKTEQVKQIGTAVSVAKMRACVGAICADAAPKRKATNSEIRTRRASA